jgi:hypothetical protein
MLGTVRSSTPVAPDAEPSAPDRRRRWPYLVCGIASFALTVLAARHIEAMFAPRRGTLTGVAANVRRLDGDIHAPVVAGPTVLVVGSSQLAAVPGAHRGEQRLEDAVGTTVDALAAASGNRDVTFERIVQAALLPEEMLALVYARLAAGDRPGVVIVGLNWDSLAHDRYFRSPAREVLADRAAEADLCARLERAHAPAELIAALHREAADARATPAAATNARTVDRLDAWLTAQARAHGLSLIGNVMVQAGVRALTLDRLLTRLTHGGNTSHEVVAANLDFNLGAMRALAAWLRAEGIAVVAYRVPERSDVPQMTDRARADETLSRLGRELEADGAVVLDLRDAVPNDVWGWAGDAPDHIHFMLEGHARVAAALLREGAARGAFRGLMKSAP